jgi:hypothetical protein
MPLLSLWLSNPAAVGQLTVVQVVATAGDGNLRDNSPCSQKLQNYLAQVPSEKLALYVGQCLSSHFDRSGLVLQDLVNELGRRLDYQVTNGRYQGTVNAVGFDGIWISPEGHTIITEVKTTDAYRISLDTIARYREKLTSTGIAAEHSSILIVVGRQDTGELEAQVRGSRHAWDIRLISAEALIKLVKLKENSDEPETGQKIRGLLAPMEYTRLDALVDVMFTAASDLEPSVVQDEVKPDVQEAAVPAEDEETEGRWIFTDATVLQQKRDVIISALSKLVGAPLIRKSRAQYWNADHDKRIVCTISKRYSRPGSSRYWYAYHPQWDSFLAEVTEGLLVLGCMDLPIAFAIPRSAISAVLVGLNTTNAERGMYWHLQIGESPVGGYELLVPKRSENLDLSRFQIQLPAA